jgi:dienelactone hydrolase
MINDALRLSIHEFLKLKKQNDASDYRVVYQNELEDYTRLLIHYVGSENDTIPAFLLIPKGQGPFPAVLIHHQHNGERFLGKSEVCGLSGNPLQAFGVELVMKGFIVLAPDSICFEDRRRHKDGIIPDEEGDFLQHYNEMCYRILQGSSLMKKVIEDADIGFNILGNISLVDKSCIGVLGHSYGGNTVLFQAAINEDIKFACSSGAACTFRNKIECGTGIEMAEVIPGFIDSYDISDLVKCIAPRHVLLISATEDKYSKDAEHIELQSKNVFKDLGVGENLEHKRYTGGHELTKERFDYIINWIVNVVMKI